VIEIAVAYYLGIDGGGTKTECVIGDEKSILASTTAGPSNITRVGEECACDSIHQAIRAACDAAKIAPQDIKRACIGAAGAARAEFAATLRQIAAELISGEVEVVGDMAIALEAAFGAGPGVIVIAGTGSIAYGRDAYGTTARAGGWGFVIGDEGSAHWIGRQAVSELLRSADGHAGEVGAKPLSPLTGPLLGELRAALNLESLEQLARVANSNPDFARLFPAVIAAAESGDELAERLLARAAAELARIADIIITRLFPEGHNSVSEPVQVAMAGGVFRYSSTIRKLFCGHIRGTHSNVVLNDEIVEPVRGALRLARRRRS